tara:strand:- start:79 stop:534 length:456 start_codon:yes stop_codon:yes gene_type:complete
LAAKIISEIESFSSFSHFKIGILTLFVIYFIFHLSNNLKEQDKFVFTSNFNYAEGLEVGSNVVIAGIQVGKVTEINFKNGQVMVSGSIKDIHDIPSDSIAIIRSNGIFGKKSLLIEPGFGDIINSNNYLFTNTKDSYSIDMFLRYLNDINE